MSEVELRKIKIKHNTSKLKKLKIKKYIVLIPVLILIVISSILMFTIPDLIKGDRLGTYLSSDNNYHNYENNHNVITDNQELVKVNNDNIAYILLTYIVNTVTFFSLTIFGFYYYLKSTNRIENFERYKTLS